MTTRILLEDIEQIAKKFKVLPQVVERIATNNEYTIVDQPYIKELVQDARNIKQDIRNRLKRLKELDKKLGIDSTKFKSIDID